MEKLFRIILLAQLVGTLAIKVSAAEVTEAELMQAATALARQYDADYAAKDAAGMAALRRSINMILEVGTCSW